MTNAIKTVPAFNNYLLPVLRHTADGAEHTVPEVADAMARHFKLSDADVAEMLPSGAQARHLNLATKPSRIDRNTLVPYPEFRAFSQQTGAAQETATAAQHEDAETPEERLEATYQSLRGDLAERLLAQVRKATLAFFERLVVDFLVAMGYGGSRVDAGRAVGQSGDGGIDGIIKEDRLGLDIVYIQAKRWENAVGSPAVRDFVGSLVGHSASKGVLITTSRSSKDAEEYARKIPQKVVLSDGVQLAELMMDFGVGVTTANTYTVKKLDLDYFGEE